MYAIEIRWGGRTNIREGVLTEYTDVQSHKILGDLLLLVRDEGTTRVHLRHVAAWTEKGKTDAII